MRANGKTIVAIFLAGIIGATVICGAVLAILDYYTLSATGNHLHFDLPIVAATGNSFLDVGTPMIAVSIAGVLLIVGIMAIVTSLNPQTELGLGRPERLKTKSWTEQPEIADTNLIQSQEPPSQPPPKHVICRYCGREILRGRYCPECHLSTGYMDSN